MKNILTRFTLPALLLAWICSPVYAKQNISLQEAFEIALQNNHAIKMEQIAREQAANNVFRGNAGLLPTLDLVGSAEISIEDANLEIADYDETPPRISSISVDQSESRTYNAAIQLNYTLFDGFRGRYTYRQLQSQDRSARINKQIAIENTLLDVANAYLELLRQTERMELQEQNLSVSKDRLGRASEARRLGKATERDLLNAEVNYNADLIEHASAKVDRKAAARDLIFLLGSDQFADDLQPAGEIEVNNELDRERLLQNALNNNSALMLAEERKKSAEFARNVVTADRYPRISLSSSYGYFRQEQDASNLPFIETRGVTGGITLSYSIFSGGQRSRAIQNADLDIRSSQEQKQRVRNEIHKEISNTYSRYANAIRQLELSELNTKTAEKNFENSRDAFSRGQITSIELREAQLNLLNENLRKKDLRYRAKQGELLLLVLSGTLMEE